MFIFLQNSFACINSQFKDDHFITPDEKTEKKKIMSEKTFLTGWSVEEIRRQVLVRSCGISGQIDFFCFADIAANQAGPLRPEGSLKRFLTLDGAENNLKPS